MLWVIAWVWFSLTTGFAGALIRLCCLALHEWIYVYTQTVYIQRGHEHRELIREWHWEPRGSSLECIEVLWGVNPVVPLR